MKAAQRFAALAGSAVLAIAGLTTLSTTPAAAATCYGGAQTYNLADGSYIYPNSTSSWLTTSSRCNDINFKPSNRSEYVRVCFKLSSGSIDCQDRHKFADEDEWTVIATDVLDGTKFRFTFVSHGPASGVYAA